MPPNCAKGASLNPQRNGPHDGYASYRCTTCGPQSRHLPAARAARYSQVDRLLAERNSHRSIVRVTGVLRVTVVRLVKKAQGPLPCLPSRRSKKTQKKRWEVPELDELWTFMGSKPRKGWLWLAVEQTRRVIVSWVLGDRSVVTALRLWQVLPRGYQRHCWYLPTGCRPVAGLRTGLAALAVPALLRRQMINQHPRSSQLRPAPAVQRAGSQILHLPQKRVDARGLN